jgi:hypothetical protein
MLKRIEKMNWDNIKGKIGKLGKRKTKRVKYGKDPLLQYSFSNTPILQYSNTTLQNIFFAFCV